MTTPPNMIDACTVEPLLSLLNSTIARCDLRMAVRNRHRWFGKAEYCGLLSEEQRQRLL